MAKIFAVFFFQSLGPGLPNKSKIRFPMISIDLVCLLLLLGFPSTLYSFATILSNFVPIPLASTLDKLLDLLFSSL